MRNFLKMLPIKLGLMVYVFVFLILTVVGKLLGHDWYGFKFSTPIILGLLIIDLFFTYLKYKKWLKN
jgi:hypothetical protein